MPAAVASSIMFSATMTGTPVSTICSTRYRPALESRPASTTTMTASGRVAAVRPSIFVHGDLLIRREFVLRL